MTQATTFALGDLTPALRDRLDKYATTFIVEPDMPRTAPVIAYRDPDGALYFVVANIPAADLEPHLAAAIDAATECPFDTPWCSTAHFEPDRPCMGTPALLDVGDDEIPGQASLQDFDGGARPQVGVLLSGFEAEYDNPDDVRRLASAFLEFGSRLRSLAVELEENQKR